MLDAAHVTAFDLDPTMIEAAGRRLHDRPREAVSLSVGDASVWCPLGISMPAGTVRLRGAKPAQICAGVDEAAVVISKDGGCTPGIRGSYRGVRRLVYRDTIYGLGPDGTVHTGTHHGAQRRGPQVLTAGHHEWGLGATAGGVAEPSGNAQQLHQGA